jgi:hypothetical protein
VFHVVSDGIRIPYDGIQVKTFTSKKAKIDFKEIIMDDVKLKFDDKVVRRARETNHCSIKG